MTRMVKRPERGMGAPSEEASRLEEEEEALPSVPGLPGVGVADRSRGVRAPRLAPSLNSGGEEVKVVSNLDPSQEEVNDSMDVHLLFPSFQDMLAQACLCARAMAASKGYGSLGRAKSGRDFIARCVQESSRSRRSSEER